MTIFGRLETGKDRSRERGCKKSPKRRIKSLQLGLRYGGNTRYGLFGVTHWSKGYSRKKEYLQVEKQLSFVYSVCVGSTGYRVSARMSLNARYLAPSRERARRKK